MKLFAPNIYHYIKQTLETFYVCAVEPSASVFMKIIDSLRFTITTDRRRTIFPTFIIALIMLKNTVLFAPKKIHICDLTEFYSNVIYLCEYIIYTGKIMVLTQKRSLRNSWKHEHKLSTPNQSLKWIVFVFYTSISYIFKCQLWMILK